MANTVHVKGEQQCSMREKTYHLQRYAKSSVSKGACSESDTESGDLTEDDNNSGSDTEKDASSEDFSNDEDDEEDDALLSDCSELSGDARKSSDFIRVPRRPMMELVPNSNVWYQARIIKERATELLVTFPGVTAKEEDTKEWVSKTSSRLWFGDYAMRSWKYLGKGSWRPKPSNQQNPPSRPVSGSTGDKRQPGKEEPLAATGSTTARSASSCSDGARVPHSIARPDVADHLISGNWQDFTTGVESVTSGSRKAEVGGGRSAAENENPNGLNRWGGPLEVWFACHIQKLGSLGMIDGCADVHGSLNHIGASHRRLSGYQTNSSLRNATAWKLSDECHPRPSPAQVEEWCASSESRLGEEDRENRGAAADRAGNQAETSVLRHGKACKAHRGTDERLGTSSPAEQQQDQQQQPEGPRAPGQNAAKGLRTDRRKGQRPGAGGSKQGSRDWRPPKELCHLLDGKFEARPRAARTLSGSLLQPPPKPSQRSVSGSDGAAPRRAGSAAPHEQSNRTSEIAARDEGGAKRRAPQEPMARKRKAQEPCGFRVRGRVIMSDSDDD